MALLKDFILFLLYVSLQRPIQFMLLKKIPEGIDVQSYNNRLAFTKTNEPMCNYSSASEVSLIISTTESTSKPPPIPIRDRIGDIDFNSDPTPVNHPIFDSENDVTTQKSTDNDYDSTEINVSTQRKSEAVTEETSDDSYYEYDDSEEKNTQVDHTSRTVANDTAYFNDLILNIGYTLNGPNKTDTASASYEDYGAVDAHLSNFEHETVTMESSTDDYDSKTSHEFGTATNGTSNHDFAVHTLTETPNRKPTDFNHNLMREDSSRRRKDNSSNEQPTNWSQQSFKDQELINDAFFNFSIKYSTVMFNHSENIITSPISTGILMSMISYGACLCTKDVINLRPNLPPEIRNDRGLIKSFINKFNLIEPNEILMGHKIFVPDNVKLSEKFSEILEQVFESKLQQINFTDVMEAARTINNWSANRTSNSITDVVDPYQFNNETSLVLISVSSFNCKWLKPFNPKNTKLMDFSVNGEYKKVSTMNQKNTFRYGVLTDFNSTYIELPLEIKLSEEPVKMIIIVSETQTNLSNILSNYSRSELRSLIHNTNEKVLVNVSLPKFEIKSKINLKDKQEAMGIEIIFSDNANFRRITKSRYLKVSDFIQESVIHVNEGNYNSKKFKNKQRNGNASEISKSFHVNQPFLVLIADNNTILASAQVMDPNL